MRKNPSETGTGHDPKSPRAFGRRGVPPKAAPALKRSSARGDQIQRRLLDGKPFRKNQKSQANSRIHFWKFL
jgi:hypothetical protein